MRDDEHAVGRMSRIKLEDGGTANGLPEAMDTAESTPVSALKASASPASINGVKSESEGLNTPASGKPRLSRKSSQKTAAEPEYQMFDHLPNVTEESCQGFQVIRDCLYGSKHLGSTDNDALDCDCAEEWRTFSVLHPPCLSSFVCKKCSTCPYACMDFALILSFSSRSRRKPCVRRRLGLHQSSHQNGMRRQCRQLWWWVSKSAVPTQGVGECGRRQDRKEGLRSTS